MFRLADGCWASLKKDGLANVGGLIALNDTDLAERCRQLSIVTEGFPTYGGLAGRDLDALAQGLQEVTEPDYLAYRLATATWLGTQLQDAGFPVIQPVGCHAVYLDAGRLLPHLEPHDFPAHALVCELYLQAGVRTAEFGTLTFGNPGLTDAPDATAPHELVRLALPRRMYTQSHLQHVIDAAAPIVKRAPALPGYHIVGPQPMLRHFTAALAPTHT